MLIGWDVKGQRSLLGMGGLSAIYEATVPCVCPLRRRGIGAVKAADDHPLLRDPVSRAMAAMPAFIRSRADGLAECA